MVALLTMDLEMGLDNQQGHLPMLESLVYNGATSFSIKSAICMLESRVLYARMLQERNALSKEDEGEISSVHPGLTMEILYDNLKWYQNQNPNEMQDFMRRVVEKYSGKDCSFKLEYNPDSED